MTFALCKYAESFEPPKVQLRRLRGLDLNRRPQPSTGWEAIRFDLTKADTKFDYRIYRNP